MYCDFKLYMKFKHLFEIKQLHFIKFTDTTLVGGGGGGGGQNIIGKK